MSDIAKLKRDIDTLRGAIREMTPIIDWAQVKASQSDDGVLIIKYIDSCAAKVREALETTLPVAEAKGRPRAKVAKGGV